MFNEPGEVPESVASDTAVELGDLMANVLFNKPDLWWPYYPLIAQKVECPNCLHGSGIDWHDHINYETFAEDTLVYTPEAINEFSASFFGYEPIALRDAVSGVSAALSLAQLKELRKQYLNNRSYYSDHSVFKVLDKLVFTAFNCGFQYLLTPGRTIFRARRKAISTPDYCPDQMWGAPSLLPGQGRYNQPGKSTIYCSNFVSVLADEVPAIVDKPQLSLGVFQVLKNMRLMPINAFFGRNTGYDGLISEEVPDTASTAAIKEQYIISNIISDMCEHHGFDGIAFRSTKDSFTTNFALFHCRPNVDLECIHVLN